MLRSKSIKKIEEIQTELCKRVKKLNFLALGIIQNNKSQLAK